MDPDPQHCWRYCTGPKSRERVYLASSQGCVSFFITLFSRYCSPEQGGGFTSSHIWYNLVQTQNHHPQGACTLGKWWKPPHPFLSLNLNCFFLIRGCFQRETWGMGRVGKNPGFFKKKPAQWFLLGFLGLFCFFLGFLPRGEGFFSFTNTFRCIHPLNNNHSY